MNNLVKIDSFLDDKENTIAILPKVSVEVVIFYHLLIEKLSKKKIFLFRKILPVKLGCTFIKVLSKVDFPHPEGPTKTINSPELISRSTP